MNHAPGVKLGMVELKVEGRRGSGPLHNLGPLSEAGSEVKGTTLVSCQWGLYQLYHLYHLYQLCPL